MPALTCNSNGRLDFPGPTQEETCIPRRNSRIRPQLEKKHVGPPSALFCVVPSSLHKQGCEGNKRAISSYASHFKCNVFSMFHFELYKLQVFLSFLLTIFGVLSSYCTNSGGRVIWYSGLNRLNQWPSQVALVVKKPPANAGDTRDAGLIPGLGRFPGGGHGNPLQYSCLENPMDRDHNLLFLNVEF